MKGLLCLILLVSVFVCYTVAHSYMTSPIARTNDGGAVYKQGNTVGPCDGTYSGATPSLSYKGGDQILVRWPANGHSSGSVAVTIIPAGSSSNAANFADTSLIVAKTTVGFTAQVVNVTIPANVQTGVYTLQWRWIDGTTNWYNCVDMSLSQNAQQGGTGGTTGNGGMPNPLNPNTAASVFHASVVVAVLLICTLLL